MSRAEDYPEVQESSFNRVEELMKPADQVPISPVTIASVQPLFLLPLERILPLLLRDNPHFLGLEVYVSREDTEGLYILEVARDVSKGNSAQLVSLIDSSDREIVKVAAILIYCFKAGLASCKQL